VTLAVEVEAVGGEGIAVWADRAAPVVLAADGPERFVAVRLVRMQGDDPPGIQITVHDAQHDVVAEGSIPGHGIDVEVGLEGEELEQLGSERDLLPLVGGQEVVE